jgi:hypothetical protein
MQNNVEYAYYSGKNIVWAPFMVATTTAGILNGVQVGCNQPDNIYHFPLCWVGGTTIGIVSGLVIIPFYPVVLACGVYLFGKELYKNNIQK